MLPLNLALGAVVGISLGLTGGGGSILAVPLLVYGIGLEAREAVGVSLAAVGTTALAGALYRLWRKDLDFKTGLIFALAGMAAAPIGTYLGERIPETPLLLLFAALMIWVAQRMWRTTSGPSENTGVDETESKGCRSGPAGTLVLDSRCALLLGGSGLLTGILSGLFGVGGGFVVVPALVLVSGMSIHRAVATSLMVIAMVSASGLFSHVLLASPISVSTTIPFVLGGLAGMAMGTVLARKMSSAKLQRAFAGAILLVAIFVILKQAGV
jgi:uncharacterized membrane protein YfcA